jgi:hypothetical protein
LIVDVRGNLTPAQMVDGKLMGHLRTTRADVINRKPGSIHSNNFRALSSKR